jgi:hypothetical protein
MQGNLMSLHPMGARLAASERQRLQATLSKAVEIRQRLDISDWRQPKNLLYLRLNWLTLS